jgi:hypothetical protein
VLPNIFQVGTTNQLFLVLMARQPLHQQLFLFLVGRQHLPLQLFLFLVDWQPNRLRKCSFHHSFLLSVGLSEKKFSEKNSKFKKRAMQR